MTARLAVASNDPAPGNGLGLAVAQQAFEDHGGSLEIDAAPDGGALLRAVWPRRTGRGA